MRPSEARTAEELAKLPTHKWSEGPRAADADEECCLCMEAFASKDEVVRGTVRVRVRG